MRLTDPLRQSRKLIVFLILILLALNSVSNLVTATTNIPQTPTPQMLTGTFQVVNNGPGDQIDPDLDCNLTAYVNQDGLGNSRIQLLTGNTGYAIPGNGLDFQPDVSGNRIAFTEDTPSGPSVAVFDAMFQMRTDIPGMKRSHPALGGDLVAYEDRSFFAGPNLSELGIYDLSTQTDIRLTNDSSFDKNPSVSPTGNAVVWEKCQTDGLGCNVYSAIQTSPGVFITTALTNATGENRYPDTNGQIAIYISDRSGENDIYYQPLAGGAETRIAIPGDQRDLSISGNLIAFNSQAPGQSEYDIYVYDLSTATLYQATNTPVTEFSTRLTFCNGVGRMVYVSPGSDWDVYAFTFQIPTSSPSPSDQINALIALVRSFNLSSAVESSLITKLQDALAAVNANDTATACSSLSSFITKVQSQSNKKITADQKTQLINSANQIKTSLGCP
jgi:hypothetical protein